MCAHIVAMPVSNPSARRAKSKVIWAGRGAVFCCLREVTSQGAFGGGAGRVASAALNTVRRRGRIVRFCGRCSAVRQQSAAKTAWRRIVPTPAGKRISHMGRMCRGGGRSYAGAAFRSSNGGRRKVRPVGRYWLYRRLQPGAGLVATGISARRAGQRLYRCFPAQGRWRPQKQDSFSCRPAENSRRAHSL